LAAFSLLQRLNSPFSGVRLALGSRHLAGNRLAVRLHRAHRRRQPIQLPLQPLNLGSPCPNRRLLLPCRSAQGGQLLVGVGAGSGSGGVCIPRLLQRQLQPGKVLLEAVELDTHILSPLLGVLRLRRSIPEQSCWKVSGLLDR
jgi:hypothetical protein